MFLYILYKMDQTKKEKFFRIKLLAALAFLLFGAVNVLAEDAKAPLTINSGDTAWVLVSAASGAFHDARALHCSTQGWCARRTLVAMSIQCFAIICSDQRSMGPFRIQPCIRPGQGRIDRRTGMDGPKGRRRRAER